MKTQRNTQEQKREQKREQIKTEGQIQYDSSGGDVHDMAQLDGVIYPKPNENTMKARQEWKKEQIDFYKNEWEKEFKEIKIMSEQPKPIEQGLYETYLVDRIYGNKDEGLMVSIKITPEEIALSVKNRDGDTIGIIAAEIWAGVFRSLAFDEETQELDRGGEIYPLADVKHLLSRKEE